MCDKESEVLKMRLIYTKPKLRDLSQWSRIVFVRRFRLMMQDDEKRFNPNILMEILMKNKNVLLTIREVFNKLLIYKTDQFQNDLFF